MPPLPPKQQDNQQESTSAVEEAKDLKQIPDVVGIKVGNLAGEPSLSSW